MIASIQEPVSTNLSRYRLRYFDYSHDFNGRQYYSGPRFGYVTSEDEFSVPGWVAPQRVLGVLSLELQLIQNGNVFDKIPIDFLKSTDVQEAYPELPNSTRARFKINLPLEFLKGEEYVLRLNLLEDGEIINRIWDLALIRDDINIKPIFVIGSPRAGTTAIGNALRKALNAKNYGEHHFLFLAKEIEGSVLRYFKSYHTRNDSGTFINDMSPALLLLKLEQQVKEVYFNWHDGEAFVDKTPGRNMLSSIEVIKNIWPESVYIFCKRRAYENVKSRLVKFPHLTVREHAVQWVQVMEMWRRSKHILSSDSYIEIDQFDLIDDLMGVCNKLSGLIPELSISKFSNSVTGVKPERSDYTVGIPEYNSDVVREVCAEEMEIWGYSLIEKEYYSAC